MRILTEYTTLTEKEQFYNCIKIDTEQEQDLAAAFGIRSIPSVLFIPMNGAPQMAVGAMPKNGFEKAIQDVLLSE